MRLFSGKIPTIGQEVVRALVDTNDIETNSPNEVQLDVEAVLKEYLRRERQVTEEAKNRVESRGLTHADLGKLRGQVAREQKFAGGEDMLPYLLEQIMQMLFHSAHVEEVFAEDNVLRKKITAILRKNMEVEVELDREVRGKIRNLEEGTAAFETEYAKVMNQLKSIKKLS